MSEGASFPRCLSDPVMLLPILLSPSLYNISPGYKSPSLLAHALCNIEYLYEQTADCRLVKLSVYGNGRE